MMASGASPKLGQVIEIVSSRNRFGRVMFQVTQIRNGKPHVVPCGYRNVAHLWLDELMAAQSFKRAVTRGGPAPYVPPVRGMYTL